MNITINKAHTLKQTWILHMELGVRRGAAYELSGVEGVL